MDAKRKATGPAPTEGDRSAKRQKVPVSLEPSDETPETTMDSGLRFIESLKNSKDKTGRPIATEFMTLPDRDEFPDYYDEIKLPIAIDTMEAKLRQLEYPTLTALEGDLKRMVANAKQFNDRNSAIFDDAERVRKTAVNFFTKYNPAYRDVHYQAVPTPIPGDVPTPTPSILKIRQRARLEGDTPSQSPSRTIRSASELDLSGEKGDSSDFRGKSFMEAQNKILEELVQHNDDEEGLQIFTPFANLPPRSLTDYYAFIKKPTSLKGLQKRVRGIRGKDAATWVSEFTSWDSFEQEFSLIWKNARDYNEDGSEIFELSHELEQMFKKRLAQAKAVVEQPPQPKLKLNMGAAQTAVPSLKLKFGAGSTKSPSTTPRPDTPADGRGTPGVIVDNEALARQQRLVAAAASANKTPLTNGTSTTSRPGLPAGRTSSSAAATLAQFQRGSSGMTTPVQTNGVKLEAGSGQVNGVRHPSMAAATAAMLPPQGLTPGFGTGSPMPHVTNSNSHQSYQYATSTSYQGPLQALTSVKLRTKDQDPSTYILPQLTLSTHPTLPLPTKPWSITIPASKAKTQQSVTLTLPATHTYLQLTPHIPVALTSRPYRVFVLVNGARVAEAVRPGVAPSGASSTATTERDKARPVFDARLDRGVVNRLEVEVLAGREKKGESGEVVELEKCTVFAHVLVS